MKSKLHDALIALDRLKVESIIQQAIGIMGPTRAIEELMVPVLIRLGEEWNCGSVALSQIYMSSRICEDIVDRILPSSTAEQSAILRPAIVVLSDFHLLGKRIVLSVMRASGFDIMDYGRMEVDELVERVIRDKLEVLLISVLMLPSALKVKEVREALDARGSRTRIAVGGAPFLFDPELWREVGADAMGRNASDAITIVQGWKGL